MRRILSLLVVAVMTMLFTAAPASAATIDSFTLDGGTGPVTAQVGERVDYAIRVTAATTGRFDVTAAGPAAEDPETSDWNGFLGGGSGGGSGFGFNGSVEFFEPGIYELAVRVTESGQPDDVSDTITVVVTGDASDGDELVEAEAICQGVTFTNLTDSTVTVAYGDFDEPAPDGQLELTAGASRTVSTDRDALDFIAAPQGELGSPQSGTVEVEQDCSPDPTDDEGDATDDETDAEDAADSGDDAPDHPTVAPAAGA